MKQLSSILFLILCASAMTAQEPCEQFLQALRDRGYYDVALDYLNEMETSPLSSSTFKAAIPFEKAQTLISSTTRIRDLKLINERLEEAEQLLTKAEADAQDPKLKAKAQDYRGDLLFRRARSYLNLASNERLTEVEKNSYRQQARKFLEKALEAVTTARASYKLLVDDFRVDLRDPESRRQQKLLRATYTVVRVKRPQILEMYADTLSTVNSERADSLEVAAEEFGKLWDAYPTYPAGLDSCLYAARCNHKLGRNKKALDYLQQIFSLPEADALRKLKLRAMVLATDCWAQTKPYPFDDVIANLEPHAAKLTQRQQRINDWQRLQLELARAYHAKAAQMKEEGGDNGEIRNLDRDASKFIKTLARIPGEHRLAARELSAAWNVNVSAPDPAVEAKPVKTFSDAKKKGVDMLTEIQAISSDVSLLRRDYRKSGESDAALKKQLNQAESQLNEMATRCLSLFDQALMLAEPNVTREDINQIRYSQCVCRYVLKQHYEAALIGEFLVDRYPTVPFSRQAAGVAMRSCAVLHDRADDEDKDFERTRLKQLAQKIVEIWPATSESTYAASTLSKLILANKLATDEDIQLARIFIKEVPESSSDRSVLNVKLGTKLWFQYKNRKKAGEGDSQLAQRLKETKETLASGLLGYDISNLSMEAAWASLFYVDALLEADNIEEAVEQLETSDNAPLKIVKRNPPMLEKSKNGDLYVGEVYKIAGKTYMAALSRSPDDKRWIEKASDVVREMANRATASGNDAARQDVNNMLRLIATQMQRQFEMITDDDQLKSYAANLQNFMNTIQSESKDANTLIWAGRTLMKLADAFQSKNMTSEAKPLFDSAIATLERAAASGGADERIRNELRRQQALAKRGLGNYEAAMTELKEILRATPTAWNIQIDAAETLQRWGSEQKQANQLARALSGTEKYRDPKTKRQRNLVWGWSQLVSVLKSNPKYKEPYYRCLFAEIETRLEYGLIANKPKAIQSALKRLEIARNKDAELGGEVWKRRFKELESRILKNGATHTMSKGSTN